MSFGLKSLKTQIREKKSEKTQNLDWAFCVRSSGQGAVTESIKIHSKIIGPSQQDYNFVFFAKGSDMTIVKVKRNFQITLPGNLSVIKFNKPYHKS